MSIGSIELPKIQREKTITSCYAILCSSSQEEKHYLAKNGVTFCRGKYKSALSLRFNKNKIGTYVLP